MENKLAITIVALMVAALAVPAVMADPTPVGYSANVKSGQTISATLHEGTFDDVLQGGTSTITGSLTLTNSGDWPGLVKVSGADFVGVPSGSMPIGSLAINSQAITTTATDLVTLDAAGGTTPTVTYDAALTVPVDQDAGAYTTTVNLEFSNA